MDFKELFNCIPESEGVLAADAAFKPVFAAGIARDLIEDGKLRDDILPLLRKTVDNGWMDLKEEERHLSIKACRLSSLSCKEGACARDTKTMDGGTIQNAPGSTEKAPDSFDAEYIMWIRNYTDPCHDRRMLSYCLEILDNINEGVIVTDSEGRIIIYNKKLGEFEDMDPEQVIGKKLKDVYDKWSAESSEHYQVLKTGQAIKEGYYRNITKFGRTNHLVASSFPIKNGDETEAACSISRNVTTIQQLYDRTLSLQAAVSGEDAKLKNGTSFTFADIIHKSDSMQKLISDAEKAAWNDSSVLVCGETGTGKELIVQSIHNAGPRRTEPFVALNCAALPETLLESLLFGTKKGAFTGSEDTNGFFDQAGEGTLYLDEINSMPQNLQAKLLRAIQEKKFRRIGDDRIRSIDCKIISSVNIDPLTCVESGQLRQDLYYRLSTIVLEIPPLRKRKEDIEALVDYFGHKYSQIYGVGKLEMDEELKRALQAYDWPGNVRELEHLIERGISLMDANEKLTLYNMPSYLREKLYSSKYLPDRNDEAMTLSEILFAAEKQVVKEALQKNGMNISRTARQLGLSRQSMQYRIEKLGLKDMIRSGAD